MTMRELLVCLGALAALVAVTACGEKAAAKRPADWTGPELLMDTSTLDFGEAYSGVELKARLVLSNVGKEPLVIKDVQAECGCSRPRLSSRRLAPGTTATMDVAFLPPPIRGAVVKHIRLYTNDPYRETAVVTIKADCAGPARLVPSVIEFPKVLPVSGFRKRLHLTLPESKSIRKLEFSSSFPWARIRVIGEVSRRREADLELIVDRLPGPSHLAEVIQVLVTAEDERGRVNTFALPNGLQLVGSVEPAVYAVPSVLNLGVFDRGRDVEASFRLKGLRAAEFEGASSRVEGLDGAVVTRREDRWVVTVATEGWNGRAAGEIRLEAKSGRSVLIPILGFGVSP